MCNYADPIAIKAVAIHRGKPRRGIRPSVVVEVTIPMNRSGERVRTLTLFESDSVEIHGLRIMGGRGCSDHE